jgi:uncharacterized protein YjbJ (UPF0337 family)
MDQDRIKGAGHQVKGAAKEAAGEITGNPRLNAEGKVEKTAGKAQNALGKAKDNAREAVDRVAEDQRKSD